MDTTATMSVKHMMSDEMMSVRFVFIPTSRYGSVGESMLTTCNIAPNANAEFIYVSFE